MTVNSYNKCAFCEITLEGNKSEEHIIPNSIGGRKTTNFFICEGCNKNHGGDCDAKLAAEFNSFSLVLPHIKRDRGKPPTIDMVTTNNTKCVLSSGFNLTAKSTSKKTGNGSYTIEASTEEKGYKLLDTLLKNITKNNQQIHDQDIVLNIKNQETKKPIVFNIPDLLPISKSLVKTAFAFASKCGVPHDQCKNAHDYLMNPKPSDIPIKFAYLFDMVQNRPENSIFHAVSLHSDIKNKRLWSYIEYFGFYRVIVLLSDHYTGCDINKIYAINPVTGDVDNDIQVNHIINECDFLSLIRGDGKINEKTRAAFDNFLEIAHYLNYKNEMQKAFLEGFAHARKVLGLKPEDPIPNRDEFIKCVMEKVVPCIVKQHIPQKNKEINETTYCSWDTLKKYVSEYLEAVKDSM